MPMCTHREQIYVCYIWKNEPYPIKPTRKIFFDCSFNLHRVTKLFLSNGVHCFLWVCGVLFISDLRELRSICDDTCIYVYVLMCVNVTICVCMCTCECACVCVYVAVCVCNCECACICVYVYMSVCLFMHRCMCLCVCIYMCVCVCVCPCTYMCACMCVWVYHVCIFVSFIFSLLNVFSVICRFLTCFFNPLSDYLRPHYCSRIFDALSSSPPPAPPSFSPIAVLLPSLYLLHPSLHDCLPFFYLVLNSTCGYY